MTTRRRDRTRYRALPDDERTHRIQAALDGARARRAPRDFVGKIEGYCVNAGCNVRYIHVTLKEHDAPTPPTLVCPSCAQLAKLHGVATFEEAERQDEEGARMSVNTQLYEDWKRRTSPDGGHLISINLAILCDERLPTVERLQALERGEWDPHDRRAVGDRP